MEKLQGEKRMVDIRMVRDSNIMDVLAIEELLPEIFLPLHPTDEVWFGTIEELYAQFPDRNQSVEEFHNQIRVDADNIQFHGVLESGVEVYTSDAEKIVLVWI